MSSSKQSLVPHPQCISPQLNLLYPSASLLALSSTTSLLISITSNSNSPFLEVQQSTWTLWCLVSNKWIITKVPSIDLVTLRRKHYFLNSSNHIIKRLIRLAKMEGVRHPKVSQISPCSHPSKCSPPLRISTLAAQTLEYLKKEALIVR